MEFGGIFILVRREHVEVENEQNARFVGTR
jgi:hypothetical protein